jgi:hypothetical protein
MADGPIIQGKDGLLEWSAPIDYSSVVFDGAGLFPQAGTFYHDASARKNNGTLVGGPTWQWVPELGRWGMNIAATQYVSSPHNASLNMQEPTAWSFWFNASAKTNNTAFWSKGSYNYLIYSVSATRDIELYVSYTSGAVNASANTGWATGTWNHVLVWTSGLLPRDALIWLNGAPQSITWLGSAPTGSPVTNTVDMRIGTHAAIAPVVGIYADPIMFRGRPSDAIAQWLANRANNPWQPWRRKSWAVTGGVPPVVTTRNLILGGGVI